MVNHTCLQVYRARRYRALRLEDYDPVTKHLVRLLADKDVANLVREVYIRPWDSSLESRRKRHDMPYRFWLHLNRLFSPSEADRLEKERSERRARRRIDRIRLVLSTMPATRYSVEWDEQLSPDDRFFPALLLPVLGGAMRDSLFYLVLKIPPKPNLIAGLVGLGLPALETLRVEFCVPRDQSSATEYVEGMRLFINNIEHPDHPHLRALELGVTASSTPFDLTSFFKNLGPFRALDTFQLTVPFNGAHLHLQNVFGLRVFLLAHAQQLHRLALRTRRMNPAPAQWNPGWVLSALRGIRFPHLVSADLALRPVRGPFDVEGLAEWIREHAAGLTSIALTDRQLALSEVAILLDALDNEVVQDVKLRVRRLSASLLDRIAGGLPLLHELSITFTEIGAIEEGNSGGNAFLHSLRSTSGNYQNWQLRRLSVRQPFCTLHEDEKNDLLSALPIAIPSLQSVCVQLA